MLLSKRIGQLVLASVAGVVLAACAGQKVPAEKLIAEIQATVTAASDEAKKYIPEQLIAVQTQLDALKASFDKKEYPAVVSGAPAVLDAAQSLATAAAAKKDELLKALNDKWTALAGSVPGYMNAIQNRIDALGKKSNKKAAAGIDLNAARSSLSDAASLWSKAQAAFAAGNMEEAVNTGQSVRTKIEAVAAMLKLDL
ncbi:MAG TPA: hypothetical protein VGI90_18765 [Steroidobacteraceae bacterium]|jgi:hypothetical protein